MSYKGIHNKYRLIIVEMMGSALGTMENIHKICRTFRDAENIDQSMPIIKSFINRHADK